MTTESTIAPETQPECQWLGFQPLAHSSDSYHSRSFTPEGAVQSLSRNRASYGRGSPAGVSVAQARAAGL
jgi:hypothetical protein